MKDFQFSCATHRYIYELHLSDWLSDGCLVLNRAAGIAFGICMLSFIVCVGCTYSMVIPNDVQKQTFLRTNNGIEPLPKQFNLI